MQSLLQAAQGETESKAQRLGSPWRWAREERGPATPPATCIHPKTRRQEAACLKNISPAVCHPRRRPDTEEQSVCCLRGPGLWEKSGKGKGNGGLKAAHANSVHLSNPDQWDPTWPCGHPRMLGGKCWAEHTCSASPDGSPLRAL